MSSYQVLARKWRPNKFADMIGQQHVLRALVNALDNQRIHHAYLFTGMRGVGKTTIARIFAKCLNCETKGVSAEPCGTCSACQDIDAGRFFDLIEVDAASRTKVDETRELLENVPYAPASGRYKVYLIDEVHMFSTHSFNALLKTLEEPPEHVKFLLATTDPQKVPVTVLSRCLQFNLKRMASTRLADYLAQILDAESMTHDKAALELIARAADGSVRDSLSLVEQAAAFGGGEVRATDVEAMLGRVSTVRLIELIKDIGDSNAQALFEHVEALAEYSPDYLQVLGEMLSLLHRIAMIQSVPDAARKENETQNDTVNGASDSKLESTGAALQNLAQNLSAEQIQLFYQIGQHARRDMPYASDQREAFDMALLRMIAFAPQSDMGEPAARTSSNAAEATGEERAAQQAQKPPATTTKPAQARKSPLSTSTPTGKPAAATTGQPVTASTSDSSSEADRSSAAGSKKNKTGRELAAAAIAAANAPDPAPPGPAAVSKAPSLPAKPSVTKSDNKASVDTTAPSPGVQVDDSAQPSTEGGAETDSSVPQSVADTRSEVKKSTGAPLESLNAENWEQTVASVGLSGMPRQLASHCVLHTREGTRLNLQIEAEQAHLDTPQFSARLATALSEYTRSDVTISIKQVDNKLNTPARIEEQKKADALNAARAAIDADPMVKQLLSSVDGVVDVNSVQPIEELPPESD